MCIKCIWQLRQLFRLPMFDQNQIKSVSQSMIAVECVCRIICIMLFNVKCVFPVFIPVFSTSFVYFFDWAGICFMLLLVELFFFLDTIWPARNEHNCMWVVFRIICYVCDFNDLLKNPIAASARPYTYVWRTHMRGPLPSNANIKIAITENGINMHDKLLFMEQYRPFVRNKKKRFCAPVPQTRGQTIIITKNHNREKKYTWYWK